MTPTAARMLVGAMALVGVWTGAPTAGARAEATVASPGLRAAIDLDVGEKAVVSIGRGRPVEITLKEVTQERDRFRNAVRATDVAIEVDGKPARLRCGNYQLPVSLARVEIDCPVTRAYLDDKQGTSASKGNAWALSKAARLRVWPARAPWIKPGTFGYPVRQRFFATHTQMANEPTFADGGDLVTNKSIYYHVGLDIGGAEGLVDVVAATDGVVVSTADKTLEDAEKTAVKPRADVVYLRDERDWYYRYSHLKSIDGGITLGGRVRRGQKIGILGKEGASGGWSHLHFEIVAKQPSGAFGTEEGFAYLWSAYRQEHGPQPLAIARPHLYVAAGDEVTLDGSRSWIEPPGAARGARFAWIFSDGTRATGAKVARRFPKPGYFSETLELVDGSGRKTYDFLPVRVLDPARPTRPVATIHATYAPSLGVKAGSAVTFLVRTFQTKPGRAVWDFGDGSAAVTVAVDGGRDQHAKDGYTPTTHAFARPGSYLVRVTHTDDEGWEATARLFVAVEGATASRAR